MFKVDVLKLLQWSTCFGMFPKPQSGHAVCTSFRTCSVQIFQVMQYAITITVTLTLTLTVTLAVSLAITCMTLTRFNTLALYMCTVLTLTLTLTQDGIGHCLFAIYGRSHWYLYHDMQSAPS